jgi:uncharacterized membrane protein YsdA (DUF1294 family)
MTPSPERPWRRRGSVYWIISCLVLCLALVFPCLALAKASRVFNVKHVLAYLTAISVATVYAYWSDKKKAEGNSWRTPETTLHFLELLGGWPAAFISQRLFRHKITKEEYLFTFWVIGIVHQYVAFDYLHQWRYTARFHQLIEPLLK